MSPFDLPPSTPPVSFDPPVSLTPSQPPSRRGRMALVALASAGITAGGVVVIGQFASADRPTTGAPAAVQPVSTEHVGSVPPSTTAPEPADPTVTGDGTITVQVGDGDPITLDLGDLGVFGGEGDLGPVGECLSQVFEFDFDVNASPDGGMDVHVGDMPPFSVPPFSIPPIGDLFGEVFDGSHVTVIDDDGMTVADFGEGDGSITVTKSGDTITVTSDGDVTVHDVEDLFGEMPMFDQSWFDQGEPGAPGDLGFPDFAEIQACLDAA